MKNYKTFYEQTVIDSIDLSVYDLGNEVCLYDKIKTTYNIFKQEYLYAENLKRYKTETNAFKEWLQGLPSVLTVPFYNHEILENAKSKFNLDTEEKEDIFLDEYWLNLAKAFFTLKDNL